MLRGAVPDSISSYNEMTLSGVADKLQDRLVRVCCVCGGVPSALLPAADPPSNAALPPPPPPQKKQFVK